MEDIKAIANIDYVDAIPGIGKTDGAVAKMIRCIEKKKGIFIYVAPTIRLLKEVECRLHARIKEKDRAHVCAIHSRQRSDSALALTQEVILRLQGDVTHRGERFAELKPGSVFLITHATFTSLPIHMINRNRITVIFDEAYRCVFDPTSMSLDKKEADAFYKQLKTYDVGDYELLLEVKIDPVLFPTLSARAQKKLMEMKTCIDSGISEIYLRITGAQKQCFDIQQVKLPSSMFNGWKKVYLMSAYLRQTQLWALLTRGTFELDGVTYTMKKTWDDSDQGFSWHLKQSNKIHKGAFVSLKDCTCTFIPNYKARMAAFKKRYAKASIVSLMDGEFLSRDTLESVLVKDDKDYKRKCQQLPNLIDSITDANGKLMVDGKKLFMSRNLLISKARADLKMLNPKLRKLVKWYKSLNIVAHQPVYAWLLQQSLTLADKWSKKHVAKKDARKPLVLLNIGEQGDVEYTHMRERIELLPFECAGLNEYRDHQVVIFLAALRAQPKHSDFYRSQIPWYDPSEDYGVAAAIQAITRGALRKTDSNTKTLIVVADSMTATSLKTRLMDQPKLFKASDYDVPKVIPFVFRFRTRTIQSDFKDSEAESAFKKKERARAKIAYRTYTKTLREESPYYSKMRKAKYSLNKFRTMAKTPENLERVRELQLSVVNLNQLHKTWSAKKKAEIKKELSESTASAIRKFKGREL